MRRKDNFPKKGFLLGGMHMSHYYYLPNLLTKAALHADYEGFRYLQKSMPSIAKLRDGNLTKEKNEIREV